MQQAPFPMQPMAEEMARQGRYGDSMLVHMNPIEVEGLASLSPTGELTINPETGQPEAFLPILAALASSIGGGALGGALASGIGGLFGGTFAGTLAGKLGTLAAKGIATEGIRAGLTGEDFDPMKALTSSATSFGVDKAVTAAKDALGGAAIEGTKTALDAAGKEAVTAGADLAKATTAATDVGALEAAARVDPLGIDPSSTAMMSPNPAATISTGSSLPGAAENVFEASPLPGMSSAQRGALGGVDAAQSSLDSALSRGDMLTQRLADQRGDIGLTDALTSKEGLGAFGKQMLSPSSAIPFAVGEGQRAEIERLEELDRQFGQYSKEKEEDYQRNLRGIQDNTFGSITGGVGGLAEGGITSINPQNYMDTVSGVYGLAGEAPPVKMMMGGGPSNPDFNPMTANNLSGGFGLGPGTTGPGMAQNRLRGSEVISPADLEGYRPGIDPEIMYFRNPQPAQTGTTTGSTDTADAAAFMASSMSDNPFIAAADPSKRAEALEIVNRQSVSQRKRKAAQNYLDENPFEDMTESDIASMRYGEAYGMQEGGETNAGMEKMLVDQTAMALMGRLSEEETDLVIKRFIDEFGIEAFQALRSEVLEGVVPGSQKEGLIQGQGGGMDDMIPGMIGDQQPVAVSPGEFIVPGDVVSGLGDGDSSAGAQELEGMMDRVRMERTGTTRQPAPIQARAGGILPA